MRSSTPSVSVALESAPARAAAPAPAAAARAPPPAPSLRRGGNACRVAVTTSSSARRADDEYVDVELERPAARLRGARTTERDRREDGRGRPGLDQRASCRLLRSRARARTRRPASASIASSFIASVDLVRAELRALEQLVEPPHREGAHPQPVEHAARGTRLRRLGRLAGNAVRGESLLHPRVRPDHGLGGDRARRAGPPASPDSTRRARLEPGLPSSLRLRRAGP